jgi:arylsulfatase A-like enzyme
MDALMAGGVKLTNLYVMPLCSPTRAALLTGRYPLRYGAQTGVLLGPTPFFVPAGETLLPERLRSAGYATHAVGKWHLGYAEHRFSPTGRGFDSWLGSSWGSLDHWEHTIPTYWGPPFWHDATCPRVLDWHDDAWVDGQLVHTHRLEPPLAEGGGPVHSTDAIRRRAVERVAAHPPEQPLFLYLPFIAPHLPTQVAPRWADANAHIGPVAEAAARLAAADATSRREFAGMVTHMDEAVGLV